MFKVLINCLSSEFGELDLFPDIKTELPKIPLKEDKIGLYINERMIYVVVDEVNFILDKNNNFDYIELYTTDVDDVDDVDDVE